MSEGFACQVALWRLRVPPSCAGTHPFLSPNPFFLDRSSENPLLASTHRSAGRPTTPLALTFRRIRHEPPWRYIPSSSDLTLDQLPPLLPRSPRYAYPAAVLARLAFQNTEMLFDISASPKRNAMTVEGRTEEGRTCARGTGGFGKRESESERPLANKVSGHSVGRGGAVRNTRTPPLSPRRPSRSAREASFRKWLQKHREFLLLELLAPAVFAVALLPRPPRPRKGTRTCGPDLTPYPYLYRFVRSPQPHVRDSRETVSQSSCA